MRLFSWLKRHFKEFSAVLILTSLYFATQLPHISARERNALTSHFQFQRSVLPQVAGYPQKTIRAVNPQLARISAWVSSVGAAVAMNDLDGDGLPNDLCYVDTRTDQVIVAPVPATPPRYKPFVLDPKPLTYDSNTMAPMGCLPLDANEDGLMDIVVYYWGRSPVIFMQQKNHQELSAASFKAQELLPAVQDWYTNAA